MEQKREDLLVDEGQDVTGPYNKFILTVADKNFVRSLCNLINENPNTLECGYKVDHPAADDLTFEIRTNGTISAQDVLKKALKDLLAAYEQLDSMSEDEELCYCKCRSNSNGVSHKK